MANLRPLVSNGGTTQRQLDADSLIVGSGITTNTGGLTITSSSGVITLNGDQLSDFLVDNQSSDPGSPAESRLWYNTTSHVLKYYNGSTTVSLTVPLPPTNYLINGGCDFAQRINPSSGGGPLQTNGSAASNSADGYAFDRWKCSFANNTFAGKRIDTNGSLETGITARFYSQHGNSSSTGKFAVFQILEGSQTLPLAGETLTFQIKMKATVAATVRMAILQLNSSGTINSIPNPIVTSWNANGSDPTWGSHVAVVGTATNQSVLTTWSNFTYTVAAPSNALNLICAIWTNADNSFTSPDVLSFTEAGLFVSSGAVTPWMPRLLSDETVACERFYRKSYDVDTAPQTSTFAGMFSFGAGGDTAGIIYGTILFPTMAATPNVVAYDDAGNANKLRKVFSGGSNATNNLAFTGTSSGISVSTRRVTVVSNCSNTSTTTGEAIQCHYIADADL